MSSRGTFITLEGIEGVGKSSALEFIQTFLQTVGIDLLITREPGGTPIAEAIRRVLLTHHDEPMLPETELLLFFAGRAQHIDQVIEPALAAGRWVVSDRFIDASYAYQGGGRGISFTRIAALEDWLHRSIQPDKVFLLDAPVELALSRAERRGNPDRFELERKSFFTHVRESYLARMQLDPPRYQCIDASLTQERVHQQLAQHLQLLLP